MADEHREYEPHPIADWFPMMARQEFNNLCKDIERNGLVDPIVLLDGKILDGRNRYGACLKVKCEPTFKEFAGTDPAAYVLSKNAHRRMMHAGQRAMTACKMSNAGGRKRKKGSQKVSDEEAAALCGCGRRSVANARIILKSKNEPLIDKVWRGRKSLRNAIQELEDLQLMADSGKVPENVTDRLGNPIKSEAIAIEFARESIFTRALKRISEAEHEIEFLLQDVFQTWISKQQVFIDLTNAKNAINEGRPYAVCPECKGRHCGSCRDRGWMPQRHYKLWMQANGENYESEREGEEGPEQA